MRLKPFIVLAAASAITFGSTAAKKQNILSIKETITDNDIVFPESFETDINDMMNNWYLQNYAVLDADVENRATGEVSDAEYIKRLKALPTVIEMPYNQVVRSYIDRYVKRNRTLVEEMLGMSLYYMPIFEEALERQQLPLELKYLPVIESALNPNAVSRAGAAGLWQFMVGTGKGLGLEVNSLVDERRDPIRSSEMAAKYLNDLYTIYNDWSLAIAAYNCGPGNVNKALRRAGGENKDFWAIYNYLPRETRGYVPAFIAANYIMTYFKQHNISPSLARKPLITDTVNVTRRIHFGQISHILNVPMDELRILNPQYRQDVIPGTETHPYTLVLPSQQVYSYIMSEDSIANYSTVTYAHRDVVEPGGDEEEANYTYETRETTSYHKVRKGETAASIAAKYGMTTQRLLAMNTVKGGKVRRGQVLKVTTRKRVKVYNQPGESNAGGNEALLADNNSAGSEEAQVDDVEASNTDEQAQIEEVRLVEQEAKKSPYKGSKRVDVETSTKTVAVAKNDTPNDSQQWRNRNAHYTSSRTTVKTTTRETTYKNSRSSKSSRSTTKTAAQTKPTTHTIQRGESLSEIAEKNGVTVDALRKANNITGDKINAGASITIPSKNAKATTTTKGSKSKAKSGSKSGSKAKSTTKSSSKKSKKRR